MDPVLVQKVVGLVPAQKVVGLVLAQRVVDPVQRVVDPVQEVVVNCTRLIIMVTVAWEPIMALTIIMGIIIMGRVTAEVSIVAAGLVEVIVSSICGLEPRNITKMLIVNVDVMNHLAWLRYKRIHGFCRLKRY